MLGGLPGSRSYLAGQSGRVNSKGINQLYNSKLGSQSSRKIIARRSFRNQFIFRGSIK